MKYDINMVVPGMPFGPKTLETNSLGGSESAALYMARELGSLGHHVVVFCNIEAPDTCEETGVSFMPIQLWDAHGRHVPHDICIVQRDFSLFTKRVNSRLNYLWCHDLPNAQQMEQIKGTMWNIDKVMTLSNFMTEEYKRAYGLSDNEIFQTSNGVDLHAIEEIGGVRRDMNKLMYCARPERGLDVLLSKIWPKLLRAKPNLKLYIATYDNPVTHFGEFYAYCDSLIEKFSDSVVKLGALTKRELYKEYLSAAVYVYPTPSPALDKFSEVSCITAMECQACGLPVVTSDRGALAETLHPDAGALIRGTPADDNYVDDFVAAVLSYLDGVHTQSGASAAGFAHAAELDWFDVAVNWEMEFKRTIKANNNDTFRLAKHMYRQSDIVVADELLSTMELDDACEDLRQVIDRDFRFYRTDDGMRQQYERIGATHDERVIDWVVNEDRFSALGQFIEDRPHIGKILDYGCAHGAYAVQLARRLGRKWTGVDIDKHSVHMASGFADRFGLGDSMRFVVGDAMRDNVIADRDFDMVLMQEVLEHVREPWTVIERMESYARKDGIVYITVPFGPWEYSSYRNYPWRCHIWHFDLHDIRDMVGHKPDFNVGALLHSQSPELGDPMGWWIVSYRADHGYVTPIDIERKIKLQRPRQTVSVSVMAGPGAEDQLHWSLKSVVDLADEIIIVDNGLSDEGVRIAKQYATKMVEGCDPKQFGFETPRNIGLDNCSMDWVLWLDTDERIVNQVNIHKYLRENSYTGYGIRQHHFACDTQFQPDMPVRLFRRRPRGDGKSMRFFGMIHEHPEFDLNDGPGSVVVLADAHIAHTGYLIEDIRMGRFTRNLPLLMEDIRKYPDRLLQKHFIMRDSILMCRYELRSNGGRVTPIIRDRCEKVIELGKKYFVGKKTHMSSDSLDYYSEALSILGRGFDVSLSLSVGKPGATQVMRFESREDFMAEVTKRAEEAVEPVTRN